MREPRGMINQFLLRIGFEDECETLTLLGLKEQTLSDLNLVAVGDEGDVMSDQEDVVVTGLRGELPSSSVASKPKVPEVLPPDDGGEHKIIPEVEAGDEIQAAPEVQLGVQDETLMVADDLTITPISSVKVLREACKWLGVSSSGSKRRMYDRCRNAIRDSYKRGIVESAREQYRALDKDANPIAVPPQPSDHERALHNLTHIPYKPWCKFCVMSRARANQHSHLPDSEGDAQRENPTIQCDFYFMEPGKEGAVVALLAVDVWSRFVSVTPLKRRNAQNSWTSVDKIHWKCQRWDSRDSL